MDTAEGSREAVRERLERLHGSYDGFDVFGETARVDSEHYRRHRERLADDGVGRVVVWAGRAEDGVLLTREAPDGVWTVPSGSVRGDEAFDAAAARCVRERAGLDPTLGDVYRVERVELRDRDRERGAAPPLHDLTVHFDATVAAGEPEPGPEVAAAAFHATLPDAVDRAVANRLSGDGSSSVPWLAETV
jgi:ADP-ribose pyrophosphatase YjhB (NUDIX family)